METGTRDFCEAVMGRLGDGKAPTALCLLRSVGAELLLWDRGFHRNQLVRVALERQAHFLRPTGRNIVPHLTEILPDRSHPAGSILPPRRAAVTNRGSSSGWSTTP